MQRIWVGLAAAMLAWPGAGAGAHGWQCVGYAASHSGVVLRGDAHSWWDHAAGVYERAHRPVAGAVMVMKSSGVMPRGHVAIVSRVVGTREVLLTHANWKGDGSVETDVRAVDVSPQGDWSQVRVWCARVHAMGLRNVATYGFILPVPAGQPAPPAPAAAPAAPDAASPAPALLAMADPQR